MSFKKVVTPANLGNEFDLGLEEADTIHILLDGVTLKRDPTTGKIGVELTNVQQTIVSGDAGNVLEAGTDGGSLLSLEKFQDLVGDMVLNATDGLNYDDAIGALTAAVSGAIGTASDGVNVVVTDNGNGALSIAASIVLDPNANNAIVNGANGLLVDKLALLQGGTNTHALVSGTSFKTDVNGVEATTVAVELQDAFGAHLGEMLDN